MCGYNNAVKCRHTKLTARSRTPLEKLTAAQTVKKFPTSSSTKMSVTVFTRADTGLYYDPHEFSPKPHPRFLLKVFCVFQANFVMHFLSLSCMLCYLLGADRPPIFRQRPAVKLACEDAQKTRSVD